ncbi:hypothetical protein [Arthrospiribacter ruber]|uniref:Tetratricopeptide repeat protein n=1 Tax=Arthrospiribacter ruber TaxID=2487934 RepID=A0A951IYI8_9BACT|nr:hypothetical protein [Arthrospiribacter ruber]MBW3468499.1 hypothetical protein [Arthrospiribacter ruber]
MDQSMIDKIDAYVNGEMTEKERVVFEAELESNPELKESFELYREIDKSMTHLFSRETKELEDTLGHLRKKYIKEVPLQGEQTPKEGVVRHLEKPNYVRLFLALAAMFIMIMAAYFLLFQSTSDHQDMAKDYFSANFAELSQTMGATEDKIQNGIAAYNQKNYQGAKVYFYEALESSPNDSEAIKYLGLTHLALKEYDEALLNFENLASIPNLYINPGMFYQALTLMLRNETGDLERAKGLLGNVIANNAEGSRQAKEWLDKLK